jgi:hypothetical protein
MYDEIEDDWKNYEHEIFEDWSIKEPHFE